MTEPCDCDEGECFGESCGCQGAGTRPHRCDRCGGSGYLPSGDLVQVRREELEALSELEKTCQDLRYHLPVEGDYAAQVKSMRAFVAALDRLDALRWEVGQVGGVSDSTQRPLQLTWGENQRDGTAHVEWHAPCGCAYHPEGRQGPHVHPCAEHDALRREGERDG